MKEKRIKRSSLFPVIVLVLLSCLYVKHLGAVIIKNQIPNGCVRVEIRGRPLEDIPVDVTFYWGGKGSSEGTMYPLVHTQIWVQYPDGHTENYGLVQQDGQWQITADKPNLYGTYKDIYDSFVMPQNEFWKVLNESRTEFGWRIRNEEYDLRGSWGGLNKGYYNCQDFCDTFMQKAGREPLVLRGLGLSWQGGLAGGICPTFIQLSPSTESVTARTARFARLDVSQEPLAGKIIIPIDDALLRADIPIFGVAGGKNFKGFRVEYGEGRSPTQCHLIESSTSPQPTCNVGLSEMLLMQGDLDIRGNLATWNTGLKNWVHPPWHPADDPTDFNGVYTIRLVVEGNDGKTVEDRITCEVGRAIAQCLPGIAISTDKEVVLRFPEQSLMHPFRVFTIKPIEKNAPSLPAGQILVGQTYVFREPGDKFIKPITLEFAFDAIELNGQPAESLAIYNYDTTGSKWLKLESRVSKENLTVQTEIFELPKPQAVFALFRTADGTAQSELTKPASQPSRPVEASKPERTGVLCQKTFEQDLGEWEARDREVGASVERVAREGGGQCVRLVNKNHGGNSACTIRKTPFDAREFPIISFDYKVGPDVEIDLYARVGGRWYDIGFTDDMNEFKNKDVNISYTGQIEGIVADGKWHSARFNLERILRTRTRNHIIEELVMADWNVGGYMRLELGRNKAGAQLDVDNFTIAALAPQEQSSLAGKDALIQDFEPTGKGHSIGGPYGVFSSADGEHVWMSFEEEVTQESKNRILKIRYDMNLKDSFGGLYVQLPGVLRGSYDRLLFRIKGNIPTDASVSFKDNIGRESKVLLNPYLGSEGKDGWCLASIPVSAFVELGAGSLTIFSLAITNFSLPPTGSFLLDDIKLIHGLGPELLVANFENSGESNFLGGRWWTFSGGAAAIACSPQARALAGRRDRACRLSYGGSIGRSFGGREFSYCGWAYGLRGLDASSFKTLRFDIRGEDGDEKPNIYLDDGNMRRCVNLEKYVKITKEWQMVEIPLSDFGNQNIDLTHLEEIQVVFEWERVSSTIYIDNISLR